MFGTRGFCTHGYCEPIALALVDISVYHTEIIKAFCIGSETVFAMPTGYAQMQGLSGSVLGFLNGAGGVFGILGALIYPRLRRLLGLPRTGLTGLCLLTACLAPCVVSVWLPGSPFDLSGASVQHSKNCTNYELSKKFINL